MSQNGLPHDAVLHAEALGAGYGAQVALHDVTLTIQRGSLTALVGPNGSGKSTLLKTLARLLMPRTGAVYLDGKALSRIPTASVARELAILPQGPGTPAGLTVGELVEQGRFPHVGALRMLQTQDHSAIQTALALTGMTAFRHRPL